MNTPFPFSLFNPLCLLLSTFACVRAQTFDFGALGALFGLEAPLFPALSCYLQVYLQDFDGSQFDRYPEFFRDDSVMTLAQAGIYQGADDIEEYSRFASAFSPYFLSETPSDEFPRYLEFRDGQCVFLSFSRTTYKMDPTTTLNDAEYDVIYMSKVFYNLKEEYISRVNIFFPEGFLELFFETFLNSVNTREYVCSVLSGPCSAITDPLVDCQGSLAALPPTGGPPLFYFDGNSQGCRALHGVFASTNPENHCPHVSLAPLLDPEDRFKCQDSEGALPTDLFTDEDFRLFEKFAAKEGIDPQIGHTYAL